MKKTFNLLLISGVISTGLFAQTTENFQTESSGSSTFTDNSQGFVVTSQAQGPFDVNTAYAGTGWDGSANDNNYIDNDLFASFGNTVGFTVATNDGSKFIVASWYNNE